MAHWRKDSAPYKSVSGEKANNQELPSFSEERALLVKMISCVFIQGLTSISNQMPGQLPGCHLNGLRSHWPQMSKIFNDLFCVETTSLVSCHKTDEFKRGYFSLEGQSLDWIAKHNRPLTAC